MKVMAVPSYGSVDRLSWIEIPEPEPAAGQVRIRVRVSSVNPADNKVLTGEAKILHARNFPMVVGYDFAGIVDAVGGGVSRFKTGDRVFGHLAYGGSNRQGTFGEKVVADAHMIAKLPDSVPFEDAGPAPTAALSALQALRPFLSGRPGAHVLIHGASGGVGSYAVQIAKLLGGRVTATCSADSAAFVKSLGADEVIDYRKTPVPQIMAPQGGFAMIFDVAANLNFFKVKHLIAPGGGFTALLPSVSVVGGMLLKPFVKAKPKFLVVKSHDKDLEIIGGWFAEKKLKTLTQETYPLSDLAKALQRLHKGGVRGKIGITVG